MTKILFVTGNAAPDVSVAATALAHYAAATQGQQTLLVSIGPSHAIPWLLGHQLSHEPTLVAPRLSAVAFDATYELGLFWQQARRDLSGTLAQVSSDELPILSGSDLLLSATRLLDLSRSYDQVVIDAGSADGFLRALALPDSARWMVRLLFGLDRGAGRSSSSVSRALLPLNLLAPDVSTRIQELRVDLERFRDRLLDPSHTTSLYLIHPSEPGLEQARLLIPTLQLHGLRVGAVGCGPLADTPEADALLERVEQLWTTRPVLPCDQTPPGEWLALGEALHLDASDYKAIPTIGYQHQGMAALTLDLPGLPAGLVKLSLSGDEMVVKIGAFRRHVLLPESLRGMTAVRAMRTGDLLVIQQK